MNSTTNERPSYSKFCDQIYRLKLTATQKSVLLYLTRHACYDTATSTASCRQIASDLSIKKDTASAVIQALTRAGHLYLLSPAERNQKGAWLAPVHVVATVMNYLLDQAIHHLSQSRGQDLSHLSQSGGQDLSPITSSTCTKRGDTLPPDVSIRNPSAADRAPERRAATQNRKKEEKPSFAEMLQEHLEGGKKKTGGKPHLRIVSDRCQSLDTIVGPDGPQMQQPTSTPETEEEYARRISKSSSVTYEHALAAIRKLRGTNP